MTTNEILLSNDPKGRFIEGIVYGTPKPGTCLEIKAGVDAICGRLTYQAYQPGTDGEQRLVLVLLPDQLQGKTPADAYVTGTRCFLYAPIPGEELNMLVMAAGTGTGNAMAVGNVLTVNSGDGLLIATTSTPEMEPFQVIEDVADVTAEGTLVPCMYTGK
jgi:hypothetical protein